MSGQNEEQAAKAILQLKFGPEHVLRMDVLAERARAGTLTPDEEEEITGYEQ